jgi:hypothetical protein
MDICFKELAIILDLNVEIPSTKTKDVIFNSPFPKLHGELDGHEIMIRSYLKGMESKRALYTAIEVYLYFNSNYNLTIFPRCFIRKFDKLPIPLKEIKINDPEFDRLYMIRTDNAVFAKKVLTDVVLKNELIKERKLLFDGELIFENGIVKYEGVKSVSSKKEMDKLLKLIKITLSLTEKIQHYRS